MEYPNTEVSVTCPNSSPSASRVSVGTRIPAVYTAPNALLGVNATAWIASIRSLSDGLGLEGYVQPLGISVYTVTVDCGVTVGFSNMTCAIDSETDIPLTVAYKCPTLGWKPHCGFWDPTSKQWNESGCALVSVTTVGFVCSCNHLTEFAGKCCKLVCLTLALFFLWHTVGVQHFTR